MIGITTNFKDVPIGNYYVKLKNNIIVFGTDLTVLQYVPYIDLDASTKWAIKIGQKYHYFSFENQLFYKTYDNILALQFNFPDLIVLENLKPFLKIDKKTSILNTKNIIFTSIIAICGIILFLSYSILKKKEEDKKQIIATKPVKQIQPVPVHYCYSNRNNFLKNFIYGATFQNNMMNIYIPYKNENISIPIQPQIVKPLKQITLYKNAQGSFKFNNGIITIEPYAACIEFINKNNIPMIIKSISTSNCQIEIDINNCISGEQT